MNDKEDKRDPTILGFLTSPADYEMAVHKLIRDVDELKKKDEINERYRRPMRWLFSKVAAGVGTAIGGIVTMYLTGWHPF